MNLERRDHFLGPLHIIVRGYRDSPQYGCLLWGGRRVGGWTFDIWLGRTLYTFRRNRV